MEVQAAARQCGRGGTMAEAGTVARRLRQARWRGGMTRASAGAAARRRRD